MAESENNQELNFLLVNLGRSLLQYVGEAWPWTEVHADSERAKINELVARQQTQVAQLSNLLIGRAWMIDFGSYPTQYTDLHYVALVYLLSQLVTNEAALLVDIENTISECQNDTEATLLLERILAEQREIVKELKKLSMSRSSGSAA